MYCAAAHSIYRIFKSRDRHARADAPIWPFRPNDVAATLDFERVRITSQTSILQRHASLHVYFADFEVLPAGFAVLATRIILALMSEPRARRFAAVTISLGREKIYHGARRFLLLMLL